MKSNNMCETQKEKKTTFACEFQTNESSKTKSNAELTFMSRAHTVEKREYLFVVELGAVQ